MPTKNTTIQLSVADITFLERRGARSHRGGGEFSRSVVLHRMLQTMRSVFEASDPRKTRGMSAEVYSLVTRLLPEAWTMRPFEVEHVGTVVARAPGFAEAAKEAGLDPAKVITELDAMSFAEKAALVDQAVQAQAPAASAAMPE